MEDEGHAMPDEWYCNECKYRYSPPFDEHTGVFRSLLYALDRKNPRAFRLPEEVRDCFEGVRTGADGEYEELVPPKPKYVPTNPPCSQCYHLANVHRLKD